MSGAGDRAEIELLRRGQVSKRLVQLRAILDLAERDAPETGRIAGVQDSFAALAAVQRHDPTLVADLLSGPQVGAWAGRCLRRLAGPTSPTPPWVHLAHLGAIAMAAAIRSGVDIEVRVPVRSGSVTLPTLGRATVDRPEPWALVSCAPGDPVSLGGSPPLDWQPVRLLRTEKVRIPLDDTDAYWTCFGLPVRPRLDEAEVQRWSRQVDAALTILAQRHRDRLETVTAAVRCLVPIERAGRFGGVSASSEDAPGAVAMTEPISPERLAATLVHEVQHFRLNALHDLAPLHHGKTRELVYSPWRNDPRGFPGLLHGTFAFLGVADFWNREWSTAGRVAELVYARTMRQLRVAHRILVNATDLTRTGMALVAALGASIDRLPETGLGDDMRRLADDLVAHHRALWRLRNVVPEPAEVVALTAGWLRGEPIIPPGKPDDRTTTVTAPGGDSPLFRLATAWVEEPDTIRAADRDVFAASYPGADPADLPLLAGDYAETQAARLADIAAGVTDKSAWASLSVAHGRLCDDPSRCPLAARPELVLAAWPQVAEAASGARNPLEDLGRV
jgi:HEXXH motif-containing protein